MRLVGKGEGRVSECASFFGGARFAGLVSALARTMKPFWGSRWLKRETGLQTDGPGVSPHLMSARSEMDIAELRSWGMEEWKSGRVEVEKGRGFWVLAVLKLTHGMSCSCHDCL